ncbi:hypothetical protein TNCV_253631, partial [Trichonephila clavipes]
HDVRHGQGTAGSVSPPQSWEVCYASPLGKGPHWRPTNEILNRRHRDPSTR